MTFLKYTRCAGLVKSSVKHEWTCDHIFRRSQTPRADNRGGFNTSAVDGRHKNSVFYVHSTLSCPSHHARLIIKVDLICTFIRID
ncbi:hypothetical protein Poly59_32090 [Rubripirellula reticaptiva]|uniref:Uncharacterized protein n=1 Tax=Rubripirellula reticaptiva TaxID=2528013 RepID=A0A5C6EVG4_9BACT|nr:hypothetical protein Poly59_32090 [Rubripirellula reticaptiva]